MTRHILVKSRSRLCGKLESDIMHFCALNPFRLNKGLRNLFRLAFDKKFFIRKDRLGNIFSRADKKLAKVFNKKKSYYGGILLLKKRIRFFFGVISDNYIRDQLYLIYKLKRSVKGLKLLEAMTRLFEMRLDFLSLRLRYFFSLNVARDFIGKGILSVNGERVFDPYTLILLGDIVTPFGLRAKNLIYKSLYLNFYGEYIAKSGSLKGKFLSSLFRFYLFRFRKKIFKHRLKLGRYYFLVGRLKKKFRRILKLLLIKKSFIRHWTNYVGFHTQNFLVQNAERFSKPVYLMFKVANASRGFSKSNNCNLFGFDNRNKTNYLLNLSTLLNSNILKLLKRGFYMFSLLYGLLGILNRICYLEGFLFSYLKIFLFLKKMRILLNVNIRKFKLHLNKKFLFWSFRGLKRLVRILLLQGFLISSLFFGSFIRDICYKNVRVLIFEQFNVLSCRFKVFSNSFLNMDFIFNKINAHLTALKKFSAHLYKCLNFKLNEQRLSTFNLIFLQLSLLKRYSKSYCKLKSLNLFLFFKKFKSLPWVFFLLLMKFKALGRRNSFLKRRVWGLKLKREFKSKSSRFKVFFLKKRRPFVLDIAFKKRRLLRLWTIRLIERLFNLSRFLAFAVKKKLRFLRLRKREFSFFLMGQNYKSRKRFFKKYRRYSAINFFKFLFFKFRIFINKKLYRTRVRIRKNKLYLLSRRRSRKLRSLIYWRFLAFILKTNRGFVFKNMLLRLSTKYAKSRGGIKGLRKDVIVNKKRKKKEK